MYSQRGIATSGAGRGHAWRAVLPLLAVTGPATASPFAALHNDPIAPVILGVTGILFFAVLAAASAPAGWVSLRCWAS